MEDVLFQYMQGIKGLNDQSPVQKHPALCVSPSDVIDIRPDRRKFKKTIGDYQHV